jgi:hypothetical protein
MSCYSVVKVSAANRVTQTEINEVVSRLGQKTFDGNLDAPEFKRELQAVRTLATARSEGYRVVREEKQANGRIVIRLIK